MGLGILGGGVATARWLLNQGVFLTITDLKDAEALNSSIEKLKEFEDRIHYKLGRHDELDFLNNDIIVINPDVPSDNKYVELARAKGKLIENELTLFYKYCKSKKVVAITGTRGKTTTSAWTYHLIKSKFPNTFLLGNNPENPFLQALDSINEESIVVLEVPSYHLELVDKYNFDPIVAIITNIYPDHLNRHKNIENYARIKANIFLGQSSDHVLILDYNQQWSKYFSDLRHGRQVLYINHPDVYDDAFLKRFEEKWGLHNTTNLLFATEAALLAGVINTDIRKAVETLPQIKFRQELVYSDANLKIYNDSAATSPEATVAAIERFGSERTVLIAGGTDKELELKPLAEAINKRIDRENLILISGSATEKLKNALSYQSYQEYGSLDECFKRALDLTKSTDNKKTAIIFSPGAKSFEKFKNEFDRGEKFNLLVDSIKQK